MTVEAARQAFLTQPDTVEGWHHGHPDFRRSGQIFGTLWPDQGRAVLRLSAEHAQALANDDPPTFRIVGNPKEFGWVNVTLSEAKEDEFQDLVQAAWSLVPPKEPKPKRKKAS